MADDRMADEMTCSEIRARIARWGDEVPGSDEQLALEGHASVCPGCRDWLGAVVASLHESDLGPPAGLTCAVLARTTGSACTRSVERLPAFVDGVLDGVDRQLMVEHARHCATCDALGRALVRLRVELPNLAEVAPQPSLVREILARTSRVARPERLGSLWRTSALWVGMLRRPQLAFEGAYIGALALAALFVLGGGSIDDARRDLTAWTQRPIELSTAPMDRAIAEIGSMAPAASERITAVEASLSARTEDLRGAALRVGRALGSLWSPRHPTASNTQAPSLNEGEVP